MCVCIGEGRIPESVHFFAPPSATVWAPSPSVENVEMKGREKTVLELEWKEEAIVPLGSGLLVAA